MRAGIFIVLGLIAAVWSARADEKLPVLTVGVNVYSNVTVTTVTPTDIYFTHSGGMGNAKLKQLSPDLQKHFGYNSRQAGAVEQKQAAANAQYHTQVVGQSSAQPLAGESLVQASGLTWSLDLPQALARARAGNKMVLIDFTGSDWCPWCIKFDEDVLSQPKFAAYADQKLVLVLADFPNHTSQSPALKQANAELKNRFQVEGFPTLLVLNSSGREIGRQTGYARGGPDAFIAELERFNQKP
ncbi:MAG: thioredoxin family protein [Verrucomicrobiia bacterium]